MLGAMLVLLASLIPGTVVLAAPRAQGATPVAATPVAAANVETVPVYFVRHDWFENDVVAAARREIAVAPGGDDLTRSAAVLAELTAGPSEAERAAGLTTRIPETAALRVLAIEDGTARVDATPLLTSDATQTERSLQLAQVVFTLTRIPTVDRVQFLNEGDPVAASPEAVGLSRAVARSDFVAQTPPILVESPTVGATVTDPLQVQGTANTQEGAFHVRVDAAGAGQDAPLVDDQVVQTSGSGTPGEFDVALDLPDDASGPATLVVFQVAPDAAGTVFDITEIPIILAP
jgi:hypothetical protein